MRWQVICWSSQELSWQLRMEWQKARDWQSRMKKVLDEWIGGWLTLRRNFLKLRSTMALTILPLTSANQILMYVLKTRSSDSMTKYLDSLQLALGTTVFRRFLILAKKTASTLPCPFYSTLTIVNKQFPFTYLFTFKLNLFTTFGCHLCWSANSIFTSRSPEQKD